MAKIGELAMTVGRKILNELPNKKYWNTYADYGDRIDDLKYESKRRINNERHGNQNGRN